MGRAEKLPDRKGAFGQWLPVRSEWRGEDIAHAGLSKGVTFNDRKLIIFRCASSYSPSRSKLKLFRRVMGLTCLKRRNLVVAALQVVVGDIGANVVDMVQTYVTRKPLKNFRQLEIRTTFQRYPQRIPSFVPRPINIFKLMLNIKQQQP